MKRGVKHENQFQIVHADFSGGLNTSASVDGIADNQLARAVNVEVDHATGKLKTVAGTVDVLMFPNIFAAIYDEINRKILLVDNNKKVFVFDPYATKINVKPELCMTIRRQDKINVKPELCMTIRQR